MTAVAPAPQSSVWHIAARATIGELDQASAVKLAVYRDLLISRNAQFNLTAMRSAAEVDSRLILDSLRLVPLILARGAQAGAGSTVLDIGSGAGIPGLPIAIVCPAFEMTMIEATGKKARFIQEVIDRLNLPNAQTIHARAEDIAHQAAYRESFDIALARAVGALPTLFELAIPLVKPGGKALFPKGTLDNSEISQAEAAADLVGAAMTEIVALPDIEGCPFTRVVIADKINRTPARYPRRPGIPAKDPLGG